MIVRKFLLWARTAPARERAEAVRMLARSWLANQMGEADAREAETAFLSLSSDPSPLVRQALAEELAASPRTPRALVLSLTAEIGPAACAMLRLSPRITEAELIDAAAIGGPEEQIAVASREGISLGLAAALAEVGCVEAVMALIANPGADILPMSFARMLERHGDHGPLREALLARDDLPAELRHDIAERIAERLAAFAANWLSAERSQRITRDAVDRVAIEIAEAEGGDAAPELAERLRLKGRLTPALMLRGLVFGRPALAEAAFADLSGLPAEKASGLLWQRRLAGFASLYRKAGLPDAFYPHSPPLLQCRRRRLRCRTSRPKRAISSVRSLPRAKRAARREGGSFRFCAASRRIARAMRRRHLPTVSPMRPRSRSSLRRIPRC